MATPRPSNIDFYAPRPDAVVSTGQAEGLRPSLEQGQGFAFGSRGGNVTGLATNAPNVAAQAAQVGLEAPVAAPRPDIMGALANIPRPSGADIAPLSADQQAFLSKRQSPDGMGLSSAPMMTPQQQNAKILADRRAGEERGRQGALERAGAPARAAGEEARLTQGEDAEQKLVLEGIRQKGQDARQGLDLNSREGIAKANRTLSENLAAMQDKTRKGLAAEAQEHQKVILGMEGDRLFKLAQKEGKFPGTPEFDTNEKAVINRLIEQGVVRNETEAKSAFFDSLKAIFSGAAKGDIEAGSIRGLKAQAEGAFDLPEETTASANDAASTPEGTVADQPTVTSDLDGDGKVDRTDLLRRDKEVKFWNRWLIENPAQVGDPAVTDKIDKAQSRLKVLQGLKF